MVKEIDSDFIKKFGQYGGRIWFRQFRTISSKSAASGGKPPVPPILGALEDAAAQEIHTKAR